MRLIQFERPSGERGVGVVDGAQIVSLAGVAAIRDLALGAIADGETLPQRIEAQATGDTLRYDTLLAENRVLPPLDHPDPAHMVVAGTGLTHVASAAAREKMNSDFGAKDEASLNPSMLMFKWGLEGGKPAQGEPGVQSEWFYKGDGWSVVRPGAAFPVPDFADDEGEEPEIVGLYVISGDGRPYRLGYAIGNEATDHIMEKKNYLYLAHSKLRHCAYGPELFVGALPEHVEGQVRIRRDQQVVWEKPFTTGEANMCHSLDNLEFHHFKYNQFLRPGDVHVHFMGTSVASFGDGFATRDGDVFEIDIPAFGRPLVNPSRREPAQVKPGGVAALY